MRKLVVLLAVILLALTACEDNPPPTQIVIVVSPTPEVTASAIPAAPTETATFTASATPELTPAAATQPGATPAPTASLGSSAIVLPGAFPTTTVAQLAVAEQLFEHGQMFWIRYNRQIWVLIADAQNPNAGDWFCFNDTFVEGEPETDPSLTPPDPSLFQPRRGFGKLWRARPDLQESLGWATTSEYELTSAYTYIPGGYVENGVYVSGPGEHRLTTFYNASVSFFERTLRGDCVGGTWRLTEGS